MLQNRPALHHTEPLKDISETDNGGCNHTLQNGIREETDNGRSSNYCMRKEANRLKSFVNWPCKFLKPEQLAKAGFYYTQCADKVRCPFCNVEVGQWEEGDDPISDHARWSGSCAFLRQLPCGNISIEEDPNPMMPQGYDTCGKYGIEVRPNSFPERESADQSQENNFIKYGVQSNLGTAHPSYALLEKRLASFAEWPPSIKQTPKQLAEAGFFYNQKGDQTVCFYCGGGLKDWVPSDDPWEQHAKWFSSCGFVRLQKGNEYISEVCNRLEEAVLTSEEASALQMTEPNNLHKDNCNNLNKNNSSKTTTTSLQSSSSLNIVEQKAQAKPLTEENKVSTSEGNKPGTTSTLCKICYSKEVGVVFLPCGHIVACVDCAPALTTCAVCRKPLEAIVRAFLS